MSNNTYKINVLSIKDTLDYIMKNDSSIARFGDGELDLISGNSIPYQKYDPKLAKRLKEILFTQSNPQLVVAISDVFHDLKRYNDYAEQFWTNKLPEYSDILNELSKKVTWMGNTFISRPYMDLRDKSQAAKSFTQLKQLWDKKDILIVEGKLSRSGVGNDLFDNASSIERIIAPSHDAYDRYDELLWLTKYHAKNRLVLLMLGPTAKLLAKDLSKIDIQAIDIGHIDSEYEWFKMGATEKVDLPNKHTAEHNFDENVVLKPDAKYDSEIVADVSGIVKPVKKKHTKAIVLAADAGYLMPLSATLKSIFANGYYGTVYVMNSDIPQEWFEIVNAKLQYGKVQDVKIDSSVLNIAQVVVPYINTMTFARLFAPELIDVDRLLYLDSDIIVNHDINRLFDIDLNGNTFAAVPDLSILNIYGVPEYYFNTGVLLIDVKKWNKNKYTKKILECAETVKDTIDNADETLFNNFFHDTYLELPLKYNYQIGLERAIFYSNEANKQEKLDKEKNPVIYHFMSADKPWKLTSSVSKRDLWWKYYSLDWDKLDKPVEFPKFDKKVFIFTSLDELRDIEVLIKKFPNIEFNIAAYVYMSFILNRLIQYGNVKLYPTIIGKNLDKLIKESNAMLDITDGPDNEITKRFAQTGKPIIGFREDKFNGIIPENSNYELVHSTDEMIKQLQKLEGK